MLSALEENRQANHPSVLNETSFITSQEHCHQCWPDAGIEEYGSYTVEVLDCDEPIGDWFKRQFKLSQISDVCV